MFLHGTLFILLSAVVCRSTIAEYQIVTPNRNFGDNEDEVSVQCNTTAGNFIIAVDRSRSQHGVNRFLELVDAKYFDEQVLLDVHPGKPTVVQFGIAADPKIYKKWSKSHIRDEPNKAAFTAGTLSFSGMPHTQNSRSSHFFITMDPENEDGSNPFGKQPYETTLGIVNQGLDILHKVIKNAQKAGIKDRGHLLSQLMKDGSVAAAAYPELDKVRRCQRVKPFKIEDRNANTAPTRPACVMPFQWMCHWTNSQGWVGNEDPNFFYQHMAHFIKREGRLEQKVKKEV